jgi:hypothetical protein
MKPLLNSNNRADITTPEGVLFLFAKGVVGGVILGAILTAIKVVWSIPQAWREGMAEARAKRLAKQGLPPDDSHPAPPPGDVPPTSDI